MGLPSLKVMKIASADQALFRHLMETVGFKLVRKDTNPLRESVQNEAVSAVASFISEDKHDNNKLPPYQQQLKKFAESKGYIVIRN